MEPYIRLNESFQAFENYLTLVECGISDASAQSLAAIEHCALPERVPHAAHDYLRNRYLAQEIKIRREPIDPHYCEDQDEDYDPEDYGPTFDLDLPEF